MNKYRGVEKAFQEIKASTGISEANEIVHKFLNREQTYSQLLISIADYEKRIEDLKKQNDELKNKLDKLKSEVQPIEKTDSSKVNFQLEGVYENFRNANDKEELAKLTEERVYNWLLRQLMKLERATQKEREVSQYSQSYTKQDLPKVFQEITDIMKAQFLNQNPQEVDKIVTEYIKQNNLSQGLIQPFNPANEKQAEAFDEFCKRNVRVLPQPKGNHHATLNESGNNISKDNSQQSDEVVLNDVSDKLENSVDEAQYIRVERDGVKQVLPTGNSKKQAPAKK